MFFDFGTCLFALDDHSYVINGAHMVVSNLASKCEQGGKFVHIVCLNFRKDVLLQIL